MTPSALSHSKDVTIGLGDGLTGNAKQRPASVTRMTTRTMMRPNHGARALQEIMLAMSPRTSTPIEGTP